MKVAWLHVTHWRTAIEGEVVVIAHYFSYRIEDRKNTCTFEGDGRVDLSVADDAQLIHCLDVGGTFRTSPKRRSIQGSELEKKSGSGNQPSNAMCWMSFW